MHYRSACVWTDKDTSRAPDALCALLAGGSPPMVARASAPAGRVRRVASLTTALWSFETDVEHLVVSPAGAVNGSLLIRAMESPVELRWDREQATLDPGDLYLVARPHALRLASPGAFDLRLYALAEPVSWREGPMPGAEAGVRVRAGESLTRLAMATLDALDALSEELSDAAMRELLRHACSLVEMQGKPAAEEIRNARGARLAQAKALIQAHFRDARFGPDTAARILGCSVRYLHLLFTPTGSSFGQHLMTRRLQAAKAALQEDAPGGRAIIDIAYDCGFNDLSTFNRSFRRAFGMTPRDVRLVAALAPARPVMLGKLRAN